MSGKSLSTGGSDNLNQNTYSFHLALFSDGGEMYNLWLPEVVEGFFRFGETAELQFLSVCAKNGQWVAVCRRPAFFQGVSLEENNSIILSDGRLLKVESQERIYFMYIERINRDLLEFHPYAISSDVEISIGSHPKNDICYQNEHISVKHAVLMRTKGQWMIRDCDSCHGVYVNNVRQERTVLQLGDVVFIMGLRIIIGSDFIAINDKLGNVSLNSCTIREMSAGHHAYYGYEQDFELSEKEYFNRSPRKKINIEKKTITVEAPPMSMEKAKMPLMLRMGSSMVMGGYAALSGNVMTLLSSVLFPMLSSKYTDEQKKEYEQRRFNKYTEYLEEKRQEIEAACKEEREELNRKYPALQEIVGQVDQKQHLWERRPVDNDFLQVRLGAGIHRLTAQIDYPERRFELETDALEEKMYELVEYPYFLENTPVILSLMETTACGLLGEREQVVEYILQLVLQVAMFHSYDEVKMCFLLEDEELEQLDFVRYLPHVWDDQRSVRFIATNEAEAYRLGEYIQEQCRDDIEKGEALKKILKRRPFYLVFALNKKLLESHEVMKHILQAEQNAGVSIITAYDDLPKESQKIITLASESRNVCTTMSANGGEDETFARDICSRDDVIKTMRMLANTHLKMNAQEQTLPKMITFFEMFKTGRIEQLNPLKRWQDSNPVTSLATPVGVSADGTVFTLDLHEKRQGPHGLVAGMTGSGKSEFLITYILSMAVNYHPNEVAFVLIDYKGGGLAGAFENPKTGIRLPHLVGTITNLDGASIQRSLMSIESELLRRQKIFNEVKSAVNEGTMDIYSYQKLYRAGKVAEPMPHLFIVSDEFAELKQQQPEFMAKLISAARIGRSLGVHLILATQKPSGVVDDQIRSNTKFRVCLRVQERSDSMDMLKRPEAAELTDTGRFYLQVGYNEQFAMGQSAWCGAPYEPQDVVKVQRDDAIEVLDICGQTISKVKPKGKKTKSGMKQIVAIVEYLSNLAVSQGIQTRQLCQPELPKKMDLEVWCQSIEGGKKELSVSLGLMDDPENQKQMPLTIDFEHCQNMLIAGETGSGKTVLLQSILYSLVKTCSPQEFNFYALDFSSRVMKMFKSLPHCGAVLYEEDVDSLDNFFALINAIIAERKQLFSKWEVDNFEAARSLQKIPLIIVMIDNVSGLATSKIGENHSYKLQNYLKDSASYGVKYIITCSHLNEVSSRIKQNLEERICLHMKDKFSYGEMLGCKTVYTPPEIPGRGMVMHEGRPLEFQSAMLLAGMDDKSRIQEMKKVLESSCANYDVAVGARRIPVTSDTASYADFAGQFKPGRIPLGYSKPDGKAIALPLKQFSALSLYFGNTLGAGSIMSNMIYAAKRERMQVWIVKRKERSYFERIESDSSVQDILKTSRLFGLDRASLEALRSLIVEEIANRKKLEQEYCDQHGLDVEADDVYKSVFGFMRKNTTPVMILFENFADFCTSIDSFSSLVYQKALSVAHKRHIYAVGCFEPDDYTRIESRMLYYGFNPEGNILLLGGKFDKQRICDMPNASGLSNTLLYNSGFMKYHKGLHPVVIPCGELLQEEEDDDEKSIFD